MSSYNSKLICKIETCGSSHILGINLQSLDPNFFWKNRFFIPNSYQEFIPKTQKILRENSFFRNF
ncbi:hypothetical protein LIMHP_05895 [Leptospira interrogans serovar Manilae]|nr:hypothetical protein LIMLP_05905 [Leptospira interrogans serovar Manilae]AKP29301.1 hypothetical protein LIMHP_05895 [Leptospira interrogans serovar Manilae]EYU62294.1 hypothetical protein CI00_21510 [Leptospira interrogans serovar Manilae]